MTLDQAIQRLTELRKITGGDVPVCRLTEQTDSGHVNVFWPVSFEVTTTVPVNRRGFGEYPDHWVCLMSGNTHDIISVL